MKYRKKPIVIEATQWWKLGDHESVMDYHTAYDNGYRSSDPSRIASIENHFIGLGLIKTLEGFQEVTPGDYVITGVHGENYPCKPDIFWKTYEEC